MSNARGARTVDIATYYDEEYEGCLRDYVRGNKRIQIAHEFFLSVVKARQCRRVLDVGCGIGHSSYLICQSCDWVTAVGVDISEKRIEAAKRLFVHPRLEFHVATMEAAPAEGPFDAILMMDVYEHIPRPRISTFHDVLTRILSPDGIVLLTTPSPLHQARLAATNPKALQIVDEIIGVDEIAGLARAVGGTVTAFEYQTVWHTNDYVHSMIERSPSYTRRPDSRSLGRKILDKVSRPGRAFRANRAQRQRSEHVRQQLGVRISSAANE